MTNCERVEPHLNEFLDGTLSATQATELNAHLEGCAACRREYQALKATRDLLRSAAPVPDGEAAQERVLARFRHRTTADAVPPAAPVRYGRFLPVGVTALAAASLLLFGIRLRPVRKEESVMKVAEAATDGLPSSEELNQMSALHTAQSLAVMGSVTENSQGAALNTNSVQRTVERNEP